MPHLHLRLTAAIASAILAITTSSVAVQSSPPLLSVSEQQELERRRQADQIEAIVESEIEESAALRKAVQEEVDRAFNGNTTLLNLLLALLTLLPLLIAVAFLLLRRSVINEIVAETKRQLQQEVRKQLEEEVAEELKEQTESFKLQIETLKAEFLSQLSQLQALFLDAQEEKTKVLQELTAITSSSIQKEFVAPDVLDKIQELTGQLDALKANSLRLFFTADDYVRTGDALYFEGRYDEAIDSYNEAIKIEPSIFSGWRGKARTLRRLKRYEEALKCSDRAMQISADDSLNWFEQGYILERLERYAEALEAHNRSIELKSDYHRAWNHRGYVLLKLQRLEEGLHSFGQGYRLKPDYGNSYYGKAYYYVLRGDIDAAIEHLRLALQFHSKYKETLKTDVDFDSIRADDRFQQLLVD
jgi:tetratricopeptide (TPR) repeat protein